MKTPLFLALIAIAASPAYADNSKSRAANQQDKILNGLFTGDITKTEYKALQRQQDKIHDYRKDAKADGELSDAEKAKLKNMRNNALDNIQHKKNNNNDKAEVNIRQNNQDRRIYNGVENGSLTQKEYKKLEDKQSKIDAYEQAALADGKLSDEEQAKLDKMQDKASKAIYRMKHNGKGKMGKVRSAQ